MNAVQYWVNKARNVNIRCIWPRSPMEYNASVARRKLYMEAARTAKLKNKA